MLNTYIKNKGITQTILRNNNHNHIHLFSHYWIAVQSNNWADQVRIVLLKKANNSNSYSIYFRQLCPSSNGLGQFCI